jgi:hypothetical protein
MHATPAAQPVRPAPTSVWLAAGPKKRTLWLRRPMGEVVLSRVSVPRGTTATVIAEIPGVAGVAVDTREDASNRCRPSGPHVVCTRWQAACPMPAARWRVTFTKQAGSAGVIRFAFVVGESPSP